MIIQNGQVFLEGKGFIRTDVVCREKIQDIVPAKQPECDASHMAETGRDRKSQDQKRLGSGETLIDAAGKYVIPGLIDIHTHGVVNEDASDGSLEGLHRMARFYLSCGVTSWCPTTMTLSEDELTKAMHAIRAYAEEQEAAGKGMRRAHCVGVHLEGPFLSEAKKGAQASEHLRKPDAGLFHRLNEASGGRVRMVTVAPEEEGAIPFIRDIAPECAVSLGHTAADYDAACQAFEAGASHLTHMFNGMNGIHHRDPGVIAAAFDAGASVEMICDGLHLHPSVIRMAETMFRGRVNLISDSMRCTGMPDGTYSLGGQPVYVKQKKATLADGTLAGSSITLLDALRNVVRFGIPLERAVSYATAVPARAIGMYDRIGQIKAGCFADLLILDHELNLETVILHGNRINPAM